MGSHTEVRKKLKPNLWRGRREPCHNTKTSNKVRRTTEAANKKVIIRAISSPSRSRERNERKPATGPALGTVVVVDATSSAGFTEFSRWPSAPWPRLPSGASHKTGFLHSSVHRPAPI